MSDDLSKRVADLEAARQSDEERAKRHSLRVKGIDADMRRSRTDIEETWTDFEQAVMAHVRRIERQNDGQSRALAWIKVIAPGAIVAAEIAREVLHHFWK